MGPPEVLEALRDRGYTATVRNGRLKLKGPARPPADLERRITDCRDELVRILEGLEHPLECPCTDCLAPEPKYAKSIKTVGEVLELARAHFGELEHPEDPPYPPHEGSGDPMVRTHTDKAQFFRDVRRRDLERREREGLPSYIRIVDGGAA